jgi:hypothetical protein
VEYVGWWPDPLLPPETYKHWCAFPADRRLGATEVLYWCVCWWAGLPTPATGTDCFPDKPFDLADAQT